MSDEMEILRLRVLLSFLRGERENRTVMGISRTLGETKQTVSRLVIALEKEGLINRDNPRNPFLTETGKQQAEAYEERIKISMNHLLFEGVGLHEAMQDAYHWALYNTEGTMRVIRDAEERYRVKYEMREEQNFTGAQLCRKIRDGEYNTPFVIYRERIQNGSNISMANAGFDHPCLLAVKNGMGTVQLRARTISAVSPLTKTKMKGEVISVKYYDNGSYIAAEYNAGVFSFPAACLNFINVGRDIDQMMYGSVCLKMKCSVGAAHMPESIAMFNIMI